MLLIMPVYEHFSVEPSDECILCIGILQIWEVFKCHSKFHLDLYGKIWYQSGHFSVVISR